MFGVVDELQAKIEILEAKIKNNKCKNCKKWSRFKSYPENNDLSIGSCAELENDVQYYDSIENAQEKIKDGKIGADNLFTNENFGCIHFDSVE